MSSLVIEDFRLGLDVRKSILSAQPGSLQVLDNCVITQGGEIQKCMAFVPVVDLPAGTVGFLGSTSGSTRSPLLNYTQQLFVFKAGTAGAIDLITNLALTSPDGNIVPVSAVELDVPSGQYLNSVFSVVEYGAGQTYAFGFTTPAPNDSTGAVAQNWWKGARVDNVGAAPLVSGQKVYRLSGSVLYFSGVGDPSVTNPLDPAGDGPNVVNPGAGFIDMARVDSDCCYLIGMEAYYKQVAIFARTTTLLWNLDPDPTLNALQQVLRTGAVSNESILQFGTGDVLFLSDSGVRSLRVQNYSLAAGVTDVGSPIDPIIQQALYDLPSAAENATAIVEPGTGRYWLAIGNTIYILSYWPSAKINAWSTITLPFEVTSLQVSGNRVFLRSGDTIYLYGGLDGKTYDTRPATVRTPFMSADTPTVQKKAISISALVEGNWAVSVGMATDQPDFYELTANLSTDTYAMQVLPFAGKSTHISFTLTCTDAAPSRLGSLAIRFEKADEQ